MKYIEGVSNIIDKYDYFIFDVWGVIHDGSNTYPQAVETFEYLNKIGKKVCLLPETISGSEWKNHTAALAEADVLFATWGMPKLDEEFLAAAPRLKAVFYAAGSVKCFATPESYKRGILISSAWQANAIPVARFFCPQSNECGKMRGPRFRGGRAVPIIRRLLVAVRALGALALAASRAILVLAALGATGPLGLQAGKRDHRNGNRGKNRLHNFSFRWSLRKSSARRKSQALHRNQTPARGGGCGGRSARKARTSSKTSHENLPAEATRPNSRSKMALTVLPHCGAGHAAQPQPAGIPPCGPTEWSAAQQQPAPAETANAFDNIETSPPVAKSPKHPSATTNATHRSIGITEQA